MKGRRGQRLLVHPPRDIYLLKLRTGDWLKITKAKPYPSAQQVSAQTIQTPSLTICAASQIKTKIINDTAY